MATLLEDLERAARALEAAHEYRVVPEHVPVAASLREHARRIREEMEHWKTHPTHGQARKYVTGVRAYMTGALTRINGGGTPGNTRGEPESFPPPAPSAERGEKR